VSGGLNAQLGSAAVLDDDSPLVLKNLLLRAQPGFVEQTLDDYQRPLKASEIRQMAEALKNTRIAAPMASADDVIANLTAEILLNDKAQGTFARSALRGTMGNLQKINELPYALYLFGNVSSEKKSEYEEDDDLDILEKSSTGKKGPSEFLRVSEAIKMAAVLHNMYYGGSGKFPQETPWYTPYVRYAIKNGIIKNNEFNNYNEFVTRAELAYIFSGCVPKAELPSINYVPSISDVPEAGGYGESIYLLRRAGILTSSSKEIGFNPESLITKTEAAAIIGRIATPTDRKRA
jgi:hypothetical protein